MQYKFTFLIVILLLTFLQSVSGQTNESEQLNGTVSIAEFGSNVGDKIYSSSVSRNDVRNTPSWDSLSGENPPVSVKDALTTARSCLKRYVENVDDWKVTDIRLIPLVVNEKWIYIIDFRSSKKQYFRTVVKMDGAAVEPELLNPEKENSGIPNDSNN